MHQPIFGLGRPVDAAVHRRIELVTLVERGHGRSRRDARLEHAVDVHRRDAAKLLALSIQGIEQRQQPRIRPLERVQHDRVTDARVGAVHINELAWADPRRIVADREAGVLEARRVIGEIGRVESAALPARQRLRSVAEKLPEPDPRPLPMAGMIDVMDETLDATLIGIVRAPVTPERKHLLRRLMDGDDVGPRQPGRVPIPLEE